MRRLTAALLALAFIAGTAEVSALHIHDYTDHDHPEHHHGLAAHEHPAAAFHDSDRGVRVESCGPGEHAIAFVFVCAASPHAHAIDAELVAPATVRPEPHLDQAVAITDVRVHGPPPRGQASPRAPPLGILA